MIKWETASVASCLEPLQLPADKLPTKDYKLSGAFPIVDQGRDLIAGWTDNRNGLIDAPLPLIVFGDHTRIVKYIDFPFVRGADGTQILHPDSRFDPYFFYFACKALDIESRGYNRHFSILKEREIPIPPKEEQEWIGKILALIESQINDEQRTCDITTVLKRTAMHELFSRGLHREAQKETEIGLVPESWCKKTIADLGSVVTGTTPSTKESRYYVDGNIPFISPGDIEHGFSILATQKRITAEGLTVSRRLPAGSTCVVCIGSTIGKVGRTTAPVSSTNQQINTIIPNKDIDPNFLSYLMTFSSHLIRNAASPSPVPILSKGAFEQLCIFTSSDIAEQRSIAKILDAIDRKIEMHKKKKALFEELFKILLHKLMTREIQVADLDLSVIGKTVDEDSGA
jgi:type I restriction enzyme S subunit